MNARVLPAKMTRETTRYLCTAKMAVCRIMARLIALGYNRLKTIAEQLSPEAIWAIILSVAFRIWLRGKGIHPVVDGNQTLLLLTT